ncbi:MAG: hypothetical protein ABIN01_04385 [Ferruginibacter sp.]
MFFVSVGNEKGNKPFSESYELLPCNAGKQRGKRCPLVCLGTERGNDAAMELYCWYNNKKPAII